LLKIISDFREAMWAMVQIGISKLDFDFQDYANTYFARTEKGMHNRIGRRGSMRSVGEKLFASVHRVVFAPFLAFPLRGEGDQIFLF